ncbi:MAG: arylsulfatase A-like enzyme [Verrucomicrobiales bacterium]|jgi:arylsulfatase A-like enzyme
MHRFPIPFLALALFLTSAAADERPNVILIMTDDQGYGDLSITGNEIVETPNMDRIATEGAWLKQFYVSPVCTPTRAHLMTGRYGFRTRAIDTYLGRANMEPDETTIAEVMRDAGYATGIFGKWHLGDYFPTRAIDQGFDEALVHQGGGLRQPSNPPEGERYHDPVLFHNGEPKRYEGFCTDIYFDEAANFIEQKTKADEPFFLYLPTNAPHGPFDEPPTRELFEHFRAKLPNDKNANRAVFYSMVKNVDDNIGRLLATLKDLKIEENTIVIFMTDNGPAGGGSSGPFRGSKASVYQGGIRTVCFLRWPASIVPGSEVQFTTAHMDLMPTILDFCGVSQPDGLKLDGRSVRPLISEKDMIKPQGWADRHLFLQWHRGNVPQRYHSFAAIDPQGHWKLLNRSNAGKHQLQGEPKFELYDLQTDIGEKANVADQHPEVVANLKAAYDAWFDDVSQTRDPNFGMPPIVIGSEKQRTVVLTPQDKRTESNDEKGWWTPGFWPVEIVREGAYTIHVRLNAETAEATTVRLTATIGDSTWEQKVSIPRGVNSAAIGEISFPAKGLGRISAETDREGPEVYQITIK